MDGTKEDRKERAQGKTSGLKENQRPSEKK